MMMMTGGVIARRVVAGARNGNNSERWRAAISAQNSGGSST